MKKITIAAPSQSMMLPTPRKIKALHLLLAAATLMSLFSIVSLLSLPPQVDTSLAAAATSIRTKFDLAQPRNLTAMKCDHYIDRASHPSTFLLNATSTSNIKRPSSQAASIPKNIFFVHYNDHLQNPKYLCAIESAARQNPSHMITIHAANHWTFVKTIEKWKAALPSHMQNRIRVVSLNWEQAMTNTPLEPWFKEERYKESKWIEQNLGNAYRLAVLYKSGGVYFDLDILSVNPVGGMGRSIVMQDSTRMNNAFFSMQKRDPFVWKLMEEFVSTFQGYTWGYNGPDMVTRTYTKTCGSSEPHNSCEDLHVAPLARMFPIQYEQRGDLYDLFNAQCENAVKFADEAIGVHYWNKRTQHTGIGDKTLLGVMMQLACPVVFETFGGNQLGVNENGIVGSAEYYRVEKQDWL
ncbi:Lactosylceramide 4-alpha-galactosyltransferase [Rhizoclosmatium sp. JEL0117]|nr:Lactosylceramide 4-alpha-galactosyltransferase [Rhizoclosmatium sp. JEL0117]